MGLGAFVTPIFPRADIGSEHGLVMLTFRVHLRPEDGKKAKPVNTKFWS